LIGEDTNYDDTGLLGETEYPDFDDTYGSEEDE
jgi:hypothetical protein